MIHLHTSSLTPVPQHHRHHRITFAPPTTTEMAYIAAGQDAFALATSDCNTRMYLDEMYTLILCEKTSQIYLNAHLPSITFRTQDYAKLERFLNKCLKPTQICFEAYTMTKNPEFPECTYRVFERDLGIKMCITDQMNFHSAKFTPKNVRLSYQALRRLKDKINDNSIDKINQRSGLIP